MRSSAGAAAAALVVSALVVLGVQEPASALPAACTSGGNVRSWNDSTGTTKDFDDTSLWTPAGVPGSTPGEILCVQTTDTLVFDNAGFTDTVEAAQLHLAGSARLQVTSGAKLLLDGPAESVWAPGTTVAASQSQIGGTGTIRVQGDVTFTSGQFGTFLTSKQTTGGGEQPPADRGDMIVEGRATLANLGLGLLTGYRVSVANGGRLTMAPGTFVAADYGTSLTVQPGGVLDIAGDGDYHQGFAVAGQPLSTLTNNGQLVKSAGSGVSVVDATYAGSGAVAVRAGTLALPDNQVIGGAVSPGTTLATGRCEGTGTSCTATTDPAKDAMNVSFTVPGTNAGPAAVQLQELGAVGAADPAAIGNEVLAHADQLSADRAHPAVIGLRFSQADVMATPIDQVQVVHTTDAGFQVELPTCAGTSLPAGIDQCVVRPVARDAQNTYVTVLTTETSRWHARRGLPHENTGAPTAPREVKVQEASPFDGSALKVAWTAPADEGAGPVSGYRVHLDGKLVQSPSGTTAVIRNPGPGKHQVTVSAANAAGTSARTAVTSTVKAISKPRKVDGKAGKAGGKLTAGLTWKPPAEAGGLRIKGYVVAVYRGTRKVGTFKAKAGARGMQVPLPGGTYTFRVRARNADGKGPWSKPTDAVRAR